jgi:hypothetical protein
VVPCPLGDPANECHFAHTAPTTTGTVYCYDNAPCHFQEGYHGQNNDGLASFETYPCFSNTHGFMNNGDAATQASSAPTPVLSHSNFTSLESAFTSEPSPGPSNFANCFLGVSGDHCHIDNSCCHGSKRACGDCPNGSPRQLDLWNTSIAQGNGLANNFMNFGLSSQPTSPETATPFGNGFNNSTLGFNDNSWMFVDPSLSTPFQGDFGANKLDFLASAVQHDLLTTSSMRDTTVKDEDTLGELSDTQHTCKWYVFLSIYTPIPLHHSPSLKCCEPLQEPPSLTSPQATRPEPPLPRLLPHPRSASQTHQICPRRQLHCLLLSMVRLRCVLERFQTALETITSSLRSRRVPPICLQLPILHQDLRDKPS